MQRTIPVFHINDYDQAKAFYIDWLGFAIDWEYRHEPGFPVYMQISREGLLLHLSEHAGDNPGGVGCHADVDNLDALLTEWKAKRPDFTQAIEITPWNAKHVSLTDPFGNTMGINQAMEESAG
jgi:uncharacterized glyoxalase superfamily protein PhnB